MKTPEPKAAIASVGHWTPEKVLTNADLERMVDTSDEWIVERTGIRERRIASDETGSSHMGARASEIAIERAGVAADEVDIILVATATPDRLLPSAACDLQALIGAENAAAMDVSAACSGFVYALSVAEGYLAAERADVVLVVASEKLSAITNWEDRSTCVLFGDGAGAAVLKRSENGRGILSSFIRSDGRLAELLWRPAGGTRRPIDEQALREGAQFMHMSGPEVYKAAVRSMAESADQALRRAGLTGADVDLLVPHQANIRIIESTARYADIPMEKVFVNVDRYGNMSSATIPIALDEAVEQGRIEPGMNVLMVAFGAGFTWGATVVRW